MAGDDLKSFLKTMNGKTGRTWNDMSALGKAIEESGISTFICGHVKEDTQAYLEALGRTTADAEIRELARTLWQDIDSGRFLSAPKPPAPRSAPF